MGRRAGDRGGQLQLFLGAHIPGRGPLGPQMERIFFSLVLSKGPFWNHLLAYLDSLRLLRVVLGLNIWALAGNRRAIANTQTPWGHFLDELGTLHGALLWH